MKMTAYGFCWFLLLNGVIGDNQQSAFINSTNTKFKEASLSGEDPAYTSEKHYLTAIQHKLDSITNKLVAVDDSLKNLQDKMHTWAIFHHHVDSWNDQLSTLEHKLNLIKRGQEEYLTFSNKLLSLELTLSHILSKLTYLDERLNLSYHQSSNNDDTSLAEDFVVQTVAALQELQRSRTEDKKMANDMLIRLSNILYRMQVIESANFRLARDSKVVDKSQKVAALMHPLGNLNTSERHNCNMDQSLKKIELKLNSVISSYSPMDFKQLFHIAKQNYDSLEKIMQFASQSNAALSQLHTLFTSHTESFQSHCQNLSPELAIFTESSDHLLKRLEHMVGDVNKKLHSLACINKTSRDKIDETLNANARPTVKSFISRDNFTTAVEEEKTRTFGSRKCPEDIDFVHSDKFGCSELMERIDGIYKFATAELNEAGRDFNERFCAFATNGPAWTVLQNRGPFTIQENFNRSWADYRNGFGRLDKDFWYGNEFIHRLVYSDDYELRIEMQDFDDVRVWVEYRVFRLDSERFNYNLLIDGYHGSVPDAMQYHNQRDFSTYDRRNDKSVDACCACATGYASGWWYHNCSEANLNGIYRDSPFGHNYVGIIWEHWHGDYSLKSVRMLIRPTNDSLPRETEMNINSINEFSEDP